jgi:hypothetical protein
MVLESDRTKVEGAHLRAAIDYHVVNGNRAILGEEKFWEFINFCMAKEKMNDEELIEKYGKVTKRLQTLDKRYDLVREKISEIKRDPLWFFSYNYQRADKLSRRICREMNGLVPYLNALCSTLDFSRNGLDRQMDGTVNIMPGYQQEFRFA